MNTNNYEAGTGARRTCVAASLRRGEALPDGGDVPLVVLLVGDEPEPGFASGVKFEI